MTIEEFLKTENCRLDNRGRWLYWDDNEWVVRSHYHGQHGSSVEYTGDSLEDALEILKED